MKNIFVYSDDCRPGERGCRPYCGYFVGPAGLGETVDIPCAAGFEAQNLVVKRRGFGALILCEVSIYV